MQITKDGIMPGTIHIHRGARGDEADVSNVMMSQHMFPPIF